MSDHVKTITMKSSTMFFGKIFDSLIMFVFNVIAARLLGAKDYGTYVYISTLIMFGSIGLKLGLDQGIAALVPKYEDDAIKKSVISFSLFFVTVASIGLILVSMVFSGTISRIILNKGELSSYLVQMAPLLLFFAITQLSEGIYRTYGDIKYYVIGKSIIAPLVIISSFLIGAFILNIKTIQMLIIANYCGWFLASLYLIVILIKNKTIVIPRIKHIQIYKNLLLLSIPLIFVGLLDYLVGRTDTYIIGYLINEESVGIYNAVDKVAYLSGYFFVAFSSIIAPYITKLYHDNKIDDLELLYKRITRLILFINTGIMFMIILNAKEILMVFGDEYVQGYSLLIVTVIAYTVNALGGPVVYMNSMTGAGKSELRIGTIMLLANIIIDWFLIGNFGLIGVSYATLIVFFSGTLYRLIIMKKRLGILPFDREYVLILLIGGLSFVILYTLGIDKYISHYLMVIIISSLIYLTLYCLGIFGLVLKAGERKDMKKTLTNILTKKM